MGPVHDEAMRQVVIDALKQKKRPKQIAKAHKIARSTVYRWKQEHEQNGARPLAAPVQGDSARALEIANNLLRAEQKEKATLIAALEIVLRSRQ